MTVTKIFPFGGSAPRIEQDDLDRDIVGGKGLGLVSCAYKVVGHRWICGLTIIGSDSRHNCPFRSDCLSSLIISRLPLLFYSSYHHSQQVMGNIGVDVPPGTSYK